MVRQGLSSVLPQLKLPPDKQRDIIDEKDINKIIDARIAKKEFRRELQKLEYKDENKNLLPSNFCSSISASNMRNEILGKLNGKRKRDDPSNCVEIKKHCRKRDTFLDIIQKTVDISTKEVSKDSVVQLQEEILPPKSSKEICNKPKCSDPFKNEMNEQELEFLSAVEQLLQDSSPLGKPTFRYDISKAAAYENFSISMKANFDLDKIISSSKESIEKYGSEFKNVQKLEQLFKYHHRWDNLKEKLEKGSKWKFISIDDTTKKKDLVASLDWGNHKSAQIHHDFLSKAIEKEIKKGWELLIPVERALDIPNLVVSPLGVAEQLGITANGEFEEKRRVTHDLSFAGAFSEESVNSRIDEDEWEPCMFGHAMLRIIHRIVHLRRLHPNTTIWIRKEDLKSAYRRMHLHGSTAVQAAVQLELQKEKFILIPLRLPFGGSQCPSDFCLFSDVMTDSINDLMTCKAWDPFNTCSEYISKIPAPSKLPDDIPFEQAREFSIKITEGDICKADVFIDDVITVSADVRDNLQRLIAAPCTIMHAIAHKNSEKEEFIPRQDLIAEDKDEAKGGPKESKIVLGWRLNS